MIEPVYSRQHPSLGPNSVVGRSTLRGAFGGAVAGYAIGVFTQLGYQTFPMQEAAGLQFAILLLGFSGGASLLGKKLPNFDPTTAAVVTGVCGLGFAVVASTFAAATGAGSALAGGALAGASLGLFGGMIGNDENHRGA